MGERQNFIVYPNPTNDFFNIYSTDGKQYALNLEFYSLDGKKLSSMRTNTGMSISLSGLKGNAGVILRLEDQGTGYMESVKLILNQN